MAQKTKKQIKHDNLDAQITVMKEELGVVNKELGQKLTEKDSLENELLSRSEKLNQINKTIEEIKDWSKNTISELNRTEDNLVTRELDLVSKENESHKEKIKEDREHSEKITNYKISINKLTQENILSINMLDSIELEVKNLKQIEKELSVSVKSLSKEKDLFEIDNILLKQDLSKQVLEFDRRIERREKKLKEIEDKILKNQQSIEKPLESLNEVNKQLDRKKKNLDVLIMRFNKTFKKHYPTQELKL